LKYDPNQAPMLNLGLAGDFSLRATYDLARDTVQHRTDAGRRMSGAGGIVPDVLVEDATLGAGARKLAEAIGAKFGDFRDVSTAYALELRERKSVKDENFVVTEAMRREVRTRLAARGTRIDDATWAGGAALVDNWLTTDIARYVFGREAELRRRRADDPQLKAAVAMLQRAATPRALMGLIPPDTTARK
jgi:hypothetical protein